MSVKIPMKWLIKRRIVQNPSCWHNSTKGIQCWGGYYTRSGSSQPGVLTKLTAASYIKQQITLTLATKLPLSVSQESPQGISVLWSASVVFLGGSIRLPCPELIIEKLLVNQCVSEQLLYQQLKLSVQRQEQPEGSRGKTTKYFLLKTWPSFTHITE